MALAKSRRRLGVEVLERREVMAASLETIRNNLYSSREQRTVTTAQNLFFTTSSGYSTELFKTNGTATGTKWITRLYGTSDLAAGASDVYFVEKGTQIINQLPAATLRKYNDISDQQEILAKFPTQLEPLNFSIASDTLFFTAGDDTTGRELWKSDGTVAGTALVKEIAPGNNGITIGSMVADGSRVFFERTNSNAAELWVSDGTANGTVLLRTFSGVSENHDIRRIFMHENTAYVVESNNVAGRFKETLWKSDGTPEGTTRVSGIDYNGTFPAVYRFASLNGTLYVMSSTGGVFSTDVDRTDAVKVSDLLVNDRTAAIAHRGEIYLGTTKGLYRFNGQRSELISEIYYLGTPNLYRGVLIWNWDPQRTNSSFSSSYVYNPELGIGQIVSYSTAIRSQPIILGDRLLAFDQYRLMALKPTTAPTLSVNAGLELERGSAKQLTLENLSVGASSVDYNDLTFAIVAPPRHGKIVTNSSYDAYRNLTRFSQASLQHGGVYYEHDDSASTSDSFEFVLTDGITYSTVRSTFQIKMTTNASTRVTVSFLPDGTRAVRIYDAAPSGKDDRLSIQYLYGQLLVKDLLKRPIVSNTMIHGGGYGQNNEVYISLTDGSGQARKNVSAITFELLGGDDDVTIDRFTGPVNFWVQPNIDLGSGNDTLRTRGTHPEANRWKLKSNGGGEAWWNKLGPATFSNTENVVGDIGADDFFIYDSAATNLSIDGNGGFDRIEASTSKDLTLTPTSLTIDEAAGRRTFPYRNIDEIKLFGSAGANMLDASSVAFGVSLYGYGGNDLLRGGKGNDRLYGGFGTDIILGGDGNDFLYGEADRDLLIGGRGEDTLEGGKGEDILLAATSVHDRNNESLRAILAAWNSAESYEKRIDNITKTGVGANKVRILPASVANDGYRDTLAGGFDRDWFFAEMSIASAAIDSTDEAGHERIIDL